MRRTRSGVVAAALAPSPALATWAALATRAALAIGTALAMGTALALAARTARADVPVPDANRVDHAKPAAYVGLLPTMGDAGRLAGVAAQLRRERAEDTLAAIGRWIRRNLRTDPKAPRAWRTFEQIQKDGTLGTCGDAALVWGALARACGIPTVWVKSVDLEWIRAARSGHLDTREVAGRVFLEVHVGGRWMLLDPEAALLHARHDPAARLLPGERLAYDRGGDPYELVLPCRGEEWRRQVEAWVARLDLAQVPYSQPLPLLGRWTLHVALATPEQGAWVREIAQALRLDLAGLFEREPERWVPRARGATILVLSSGGRPALPDAWARDWLPNGYAAWIAATADGKPDWIERTLPDGTRVVLVRAEDQVGIQKAVADAVR